jgi:hypothetical protein
MEVNDMRQRINAIGDRLLGLFVPGVRASAEPCGAGYDVFCFCSGGRYYQKHCCNNGLDCGSCRYVGPFC